MNWADERYVRFYTRNTPEWTLLSWEARGLFGLLLREVDRAGVIDLGKAGPKALASALRAPVAVCERVIAEWLEDGCVEQNGSTLVIPNFIDAQEAPQSDKVRQAESRARRRDQARMHVTNRDSQSQIVTERHESSQSVTDGHIESLRAVPCRAVPSVPDQKLPLARTHARARDVGDGDGDPLSPSPKGIETHGVLSFLGECSEIREVGDRNAGIPGLVFDAPPDPNQHRKWYGDQIAALVNRKICPDATEAHKLLVDAYRLYLRDPHWRSQAPPAPWRGYRKQVFDWALKAAGLAEPEKRASWKDANGVLHVTEVDAQGF